MDKDRAITFLTVLAITVGVVGISANDAESLGGFISFLTVFATTVAILAIFTLGLNVQWGYTGVFNFGIAGFFMVGAYTSAILTKRPASGQFEEYVAGYGDKLDFLPFLQSDMWLPFLIGITAAGLAAGALAFLVGIPTLRLREDYLAIATIGVAEVLRRVSVEERWLVNGTRGMAGIPRPLHDLVSPPDYKFVFLAIAVAILLIVFLAIERGSRSPWGRVLKAIREDEVTAAASGKDIFAFKMQAFVFGAMIMGVGGAVYAHNQGAVSPDTFSHFFGTFIIWAMLIVGGSGNNKGAVLGAYVIWGFWTVTGLARTHLPEALETRVFYIRDLVIGLLIIGALLLRPKGLLGEERRVSVFIEGEAKRGAAKVGAPAPGDPSRPSRPAPGQAKQDSDSHGQAEN